MDQPITYGGLDVHKDTIAIALAEAGKRGDVHEHGKIANTAATLMALAAQLARGERELRFCYGRRRRASTALAATASSGS